MYPAKIVFFLIAFAATGTLYGQQATVTLKSKDIPMSGVIEEIEKTTPYTFLYSDRQIGPLLHLNVNFKNADIHKVLKYCLQKSGLTYELVDKTIIIIPESPEEYSDTKNTTAPPASSYTLLEGKIKDTEGNALPGVNVYIKDSPGRGSASDEKGYFRIRVKKGDIVFFSSIGYITKEIFIEKPTTELNIRLEQNDEKIEEVQVVGYGTQRKISVVGAISNMSLEGRNFPVTSFSNAIAGSMSGIIGVQRSGEPGEDISEFWIRGVSTFGSKDKALILIDGIERTTFNDLMPEDIESFSVLKDATATAIYGARGANGVLLVNTRRGKAGRLQIRFHAKTMLSSLPRLPDYLNASDYALLSNEAREVRGESPVYTDAILQVIRQGLDPDLYPDVDWQKELLKKRSFGAQFNISCSGGGNIARYYISGNYRTNDAIYKESPANHYRTNVLRRQYSFRTNLDINISPSTLLAANFATNIITMNRPGIGTTEKIWKIQADLNPLAVPKRYSTGQAPCYGPFNEASPDILLTESGYVTEFRNNIETRMELRQDLSCLTKGWQVALTIAYDAIGEQTSARSKMPDLYQATGRDARGKLLLEHKAEKKPITFTNHSSGERRFYFEGKSDYERIFNNHRITGLILFNLSQYSTDKATDILSSIPERYMGLAGRLTWAFRDTYFTELNFGYNGTSNFPKGQRFGFFPSVATGCILSNFDWSRHHLPWLDFLKLRYSFGLVGNDQIAQQRFPYLGQVNVNAPGFSFGNNGENSAPGITESVIGTDNLVWEKAFKHDLGVEIGIDKIFLELDYFRDLRKGIFMQRENLPLTAGIPSKPYGNVGRMENHGYEGTLTYKDKRGNSEWELRANFTYTNNKIIDYDEPHLPYDYLMHKGKSLDATRGFIALGYFRDSTDIRNSPKHPDQVRPGDLKYKDVNGDGNIDDNDMVVIGNSSIPRLQYGFAINYKWKEWDLGIFFRGAGATDYLYGGQGYFPFINEEVGNILSITGKSDNRWIPAWYSGNPQTENPDARFPRLSYGPNKNNFRPSTHWLANGSYLRLKTLEIGYSLPDRSLYKLRLSKFRISILGDNLQVWDKIKLWDPEQASSNGAVYPLTRSFVFNLQVVL